MDSILRRKHVLKNCCLAKSDRNMFLRWEHVLKIVTDENVTGAHLQKCIFFQPITACYDLNCLCTIGEVPRIRIIALTHFDQTRGKRVLTFWCWYVRGNFRTENYMDVTWVCLNLCCLYVHFNWDASLMKRFFKTYIVSAKSEKAYLACWPSIKTFIFKM